MHGLSSTPLGFVNNATQLIVNLSIPIKTSCSGNMCDGQRVKYWINIKYCGCYGMSTNSTNLVIHNAISVKTVQYGRFQMDEYSSLKFSKLYLNTDINGLVGSNHGNLQNTLLLALCYRALRELPRCTVQG